MSNKQTLEDRLNVIISEKDDQIDELEQKVEDLSARLDYANFVWQHHFAFENDEFFGQMPFPRLEMRLNRLSKDNWYSIEWVYGLVFKHATEIYGDGNMLLFIPFSKTTSNSSRGTFDSWCKSGKLHLPHRDSAHIYLESKVLNLPAFIICQEMGIINRIDREGDYSETLSKMKSDGTKDRFTFTGI